MSLMIERVAKALENLPHEKFDGTESQNRAILETYARAAIEVMRTPIEKMGMAGADRLDVMDRRSEATDVVAEEVFILMIDAALEP